MPWDGTELRVTDLESGAVTTLAGSVSESVLQPEWVDDATLTMISDRSGWWNLYSVTLQGKGGVLHHEDAEFGGPLWQLGARTYGALDEARILAVRTVGDDSLVILDLAVGTSATIDLPLTSIRLGPQSGCRVLLTGGTSSLAGGLRMLDLSDGLLTDVRLDVDAMPDLAYVPLAETRTFHEARGVHTFVYPPRNDEFTAPEGESPLPEASAVYQERSPLTHVSSLTTPVLLLQGLDDEIVPPAQAELFRDALAAKRLPHV